MNGAPRLELRSYSLNMFNGKRSESALKRRAERRAERRQGMAAAEAELAPKQEQNWVCSDPKCANINFERRIVCHLCGLPNPAPRAKPAAEVKVSI